MLVDGGLFSEAGLGYIIVAVTALALAVLYFRRALSYKAMAIAGAVCTCVDSFLLHAHPIMLTLDTLSTLYPAWRLLQQRKAQRR
ncbi:hypothetical protein [Paraburkholderia youngii]|uniref:hypothetical protein n=1 Tax=Paraburkholderia youngii TaxID=2782701 RepID=UPI003D217752